jgi:Glycine rich protein
MVSTGIPVYGGQVLYVLVGGQNGFNGGGDERVNDVGGIWGVYSCIGNGGGATDVRTAVSDVSSRIAVAGKQAMRSISS